jgi:thiazole synthase ThiGH ThiG subunit
MNRVSDAKLAIACHNAGIFPSLSLYTWQNRHDPGINEHIVEREIKTFQDATGSNNILLSFLAADLVHERICELLVKFNIKYVEFIDGMRTKPLEDGKTIKEIFIERYDLDLKVLTKRLNAQGLFVPQALDGIIFKGPEGAGRGEASINVEDEIKLLRIKYPTIPVIMSGGISTKEDIAKYLNLGCIAVCIGTLLAVSEESSISVETKLKMIESSYQSVTRTRLTDQNALIFSALPDDDKNNTYSLIAGIKTPNEGLVFAGKALDTIKSIRPVKDIIQELVS